MVLTTVCHQFLIVQSVQAGKGPGSKLDHTVVWRPIGTFLETVFVHTERLALNPWHTSRHILSHCQLVAGVLTEARRSTLFCARELEGLYCTLNEHIGDASSWCRTSIGYGQTSHEDLEKGE